MKLRMVALILAALTLGSAASPASAQVAVSICKTASRAPHSIEQQCGDGSIQQVFFDQPGLIVIQDFQGQTTYPPARETVGRYYGPWLLWTDYTGARCATGAAISQAMDFYPILCPPAEYPTDPPVLH